MFSPRVEDIKVCNQLIKVVKRADWVKPKEVVRTSFSLAKLQREEYRDVYHLLTYSSYVLENYNVVVRDNGKIVLLVPSGNVKSDYLEVEMNELSQHIKRNHFSLYCMLVNLFTMLLVASLTLFLSS